MRATGRRGQRVLIEGGGLRACTRNRSRAGPRAWGCWRDGPHGAAGAAPSAAHMATGHKALKCNTDENAGTLGFGTAGALGTAPARCGGIGTHAGTASLPGKGRRPPPAAPAPPRVPGCGSGWSREHCRASGCVTATARCRRLVLREGWGGRDAKRNVSGASGSGCKRGARAQGERATATALKGLYPAQVRRINWRHELYAG